MDFANGVIKTKAIMSIIEKLEESHGQTNIDKCRVITHLILQIIISKSEHHINISLNRKHTGTFVLYSHMYSDLIV